MARLLIKDLQYQIESLERALTASQRECHDLERDLKDANKSVDNLLRAQLKYEKEAACGDNPIVDSVSELTPEQLEARFCELGLLPCGHPPMRDGVCGIPWCKPRAYMALDVRSLRELPTHLL